VQGLQGRQDAVDQDGVGKTIGIQRGTDGGHLSSIKKKGSKPAGLKTRNVIPIYWLVNSYSHQPTRVLNNVYVAKGGKVQQNQALVLHVISGQL